MLEGFSTNVFRRRFPDIPITQLAIMECSCIQVLTDLAFDPAFRGTVICELPEGMLTTFASQRYSKKEFTDRQPTSWRVDFENQIEWRLQDALCCRNPTFSLNHTLRALLGADRWPEPGLWAVRFDRSCLVWYDNPEVLAQKRSRTIAHVRSWMEQNFPRSLTPQDWLGQASQVEPAVRELQRKGGKVAFVMFPSSGETLLLQEQYFPKKRFWDRFAAATSGVTIHFRDVPALAATETPDTEHIDETHSDQFTEGLIDELVDKGVLPSEGSTLDR